MIDQNQFEAMQLRERIALATAAAMFVAGVLLVTVILPAEYGVDPVGSGRAFGLTQIAGAESTPQAPVAGATPGTGTEAVPAIEGEGGRPTLGFTQVPASTTGPDGEPILEWNRAGADHAQPQTFRRDARTFALGPDEAMEFKYRIEKDGGFVYSWKATGRVQVDFHGEPEGKPRGYAEFYNQSQREAAQGTFVAAAPGIHGWYWKNLSSKPITITLTTAGFYARGIEFRESGRTEHAIPE